MNDIETVYIFQGEFYTFSSTDYPPFMQSYRLDLPAVLYYGDEGYIAPPIISTYTQYKTNTFI